MEPGESWERYTRMLCHNYNIFTSNSTLTEFESLHDIHFAVISRAQQGFQHRRRKFLNSTTLLRKFRKFTSQLSLLRVKTALQPWEIICSVSSKAIYSNFIYISLFFMFTCLRIYISHQENKLHVVIPCLAKRKQRQSIFTILWRIFDLLKNWKCWHSKEPLKDFWHFSSNQCT